MQKVKFLQDIKMFKKDTYRVIMAEDPEYYHVQIDLNSFDAIPFHKSKKWNIVSSNRKKLNNANFLY